MTHSPLSDSDLYARVRHLLRAEIELFGSCANGARVLRDGSLVASINPRAPDRSLFNWVTTDDPAALLACYDDLARTYRDAGVRAWAIWVDRDDTATERALIARGHTLDGRPPAMGALIETLTLTDPGDLDYRQTSDAALIAHINDQAYAFPPPAFSAALTRLPPTARAYLAHHQGHPAACLVTHETPEADCGITLVATIPTARRAHLATRLLSAALRSAQTRGARTTTLQASSKGAPLYARLGYRHLGSMSIWEHRISAP